VTVIEASPLRNALLLSSAAVPASGAVRFARAVCAKSCPHIHTCQQCVDGKPGNDNRKPPAHAANAGEVFAVFLPLGLTSFDSPTPATSHWASPHSSCFFQWRAPPWLVVLFCAAGGEALSLLPLGH
jgi:hypothetical protein